jgi:copper transport protein
MVFSIGHLGEAPASTQVPADARVQSLIWLARVALYLGLFGGVGGAVFAAWIAPKQSAVPGFIRPALGLSLMAAAASLGLQGLDALGLDLSAIISPPFG